MTHTLKGHTFSSALKHVRNVCTQIPPIETNAAFTDQGRHIIECQAELQVAGKFNLAAHAWQAKCIGECLAGTACQHLRSVTRTLVRVENLAYRYCSDTSQTLVT